MNRKEIADIITLSGIGGLEKEIKKEVNRNDKEWLIAITLVSIFWVGSWLMERESARNEIQQFKYDYASKVGKQYGIAMDSLVKISQNNGIENCIIEK
jgi:hypothetical protein